MPLVVYLVRHGETDDNAAGIIQGHIDTPLNATGEQQARALGTRFRERSISFDRCFTSDLQRAAKTADIITSYCSSTVDKVTDARVRERHLGTLQGKPYTEKAFRDNSTIEPQGPYTQRLLDFWDALVALQVPSDQPRHVLVTTHGGPIKTLVPALTSQRGYECCELARKVPNCSVTMIEVESPWAGRIVTFADSSWIGDTKLQTEAEGDAEAIEPSVAANGSGSNSHA